MPEGDKPVQPKEAKMVPEKDLLAVAARRDKYKAELAEKDSLVAKLQAELRVAKLNVEDDEEIKAVKEYLLGLADSIDQREKKHSKDLADFEEREKDSRVKALAEEYGVDLDVIKDAEDPEKEALRIVARQAKENKEKAPESVVDLSPSVTTKKNVWDMSDDEFNKKIKDRKFLGVNKNEFTGYLRELGFDGPNAKPRLRIPFPGDSPTVEGWAVKTCLVYVPLVLRKLEIKEIKPIKEAK